MGVKLRKRYECICEWCRKRFHTARPDARTCSGKCRQRMRYFEQQFGYAPRSIPGDVTAQLAADLEIMRLIRAERKRIEEEDAYFATGSAGVK